MMNLAHTQDNTENAIHLIPSKIKTSALGKNIADQKELDLLRQQVNKQAQCLQVIQSRSTTLLELNETLKKGNKQYINQLKTLRISEQHNKNQLHKLAHELKHSQNREGLLTKKCEHYLDQLQLKTLDEETASTELCTTSITLNQTTEHQELQQRQYEQLLLNYNELVAKYDTSLKHGWFTAKMDGFYNAIIAIKHYVKALPTHRLFKASRELQTENTYSEIAKPSWIHANKDLPIKTGIYQVSNGKKSALAYFNAETKQFKQPAFDIRFWLQRAESAGINAINNGFSA